jgi:hypothetical protein
MKVIDPSIDFDNLEALRLANDLSVAFTLAVRKKDCHGICRPFAEILWVQNEFIDNFTACHRLSDGDTFSVGQVVKAPSVNV